MSRFVGITSLQGNLVNRTVLIPRRVGYSQENPKGHPFETNPIQVDSLTTRRSQVFVWIPEDSVSVVPLVWRSSVFLHQTQDHANGQTYYRVLFLPYLPPTVEETESPLSLETTVYNHPTTHSSGHKKIRGLTV